MSNPDRTFMGDFRKFFAKGMAILLPTVLTIALLLYVVMFLWNNIAAPINAGVRWSVINVAPRIIGEASMPDWYVVTDEELADGMARLRPTPANEQDAVERVRREAFQSVWSSHWYLEAIGFIVAIMLVYLAGVLLGNFIGRRIYARVEKLFLKVPMVRQVYPSVKQVTDFVLGDEAKKKSFPSNRVVLVEYPRRGIWTVGLMTGETMKSVEHIAGTRCVTVFIPSSPTPFTGYTITVPATEVYELPITMDETLRFVVSGGVLVPDREVPDTPAQINRQEMIGQAGGPKGDLAAAAEGSIMEENERAGEGPSERESA